MSAVLENPDYEVPLLTARYKRFTKPVKCFEASNKDFPQLGIGLQRHHSLAHLSRLKCVSGHK